MNFGVRKPSIKRSIKARTTGRIKRTIKSTYNPLYSKKGMGMINNPKKAIYNKVYNKTTVDCLESLKQKGNQKSNSNKETYIMDKETLKKQFNLTDWDIQKVVNGENLNINITNRKNKTSNKESIPTKKELLKQIPKEKRVNYFDKEAHCCLCNENLGIWTLRPRFQLIDGWLCSKCLKSFCNFIDFKRKAYTVEIVKTKFHNKI